MRGYIISIAYLLFLFFTDSSQETYPSICYKVPRFLSLLRCYVMLMFYVDVCVLLQIAAKKHILQYAIKFEDFEFVKMLCDAGADILCYFFLVFTDSSQETHTSIFYKVPRF